MLESNNVYYRRAIMNDSKPAVSDRLGNINMSVGWKRLGGIFEPSCNSDVVGTEVAGGKGSHNDREVGPPDHQGAYKHPLESLIKLSLHESYKIHHHIWMVERLVL